MKIKILGIDYDIERLDEEDETMKVMNAKGYTDSSSHKIRYMKSNEGPAFKEIPKQTEDIILRHELIHAFLFESGIDCGMQFHNEKMVDWLALQFPKMRQLFDELKI